MKMTYLVFVLAVILATSCSKTTPGEPSGLVGTWQSVSAIADGKPTPDALIAHIRITFTKDRYQTQQDSEVVFDSTYTVDTSKNPREINIMGTEGEFKEKEGLGIYLVQDDTLKICYTLPGKPRPSTFESTPGSKVFFIVCKRQKL